MSKSLIVILSAFAIVGFQNCSQNASFKALEQSALSSSDITNSSSSASSSISDSSVLKAKTSNFPHCFYSNSGGTVPSQAGTGSTAVFGPDECLESLREFADANPSPNLVLKLNGVKIEPSQLDALISASSEQPPFCSYGDRADSEGRINGAVAVFNRAHCLSVCKELTISNHRPMNCYSNGVLLSDSEVLVAPDSFSVASLRTISSDQ